MNLYSLRLPESKVLSYAAAVVEQTQHDTAARQGEEHVDAALHIVVAAAVEAAQIGGNQRQVGEQHDHGVAAQIRVQVVGDRGQLVDEPAVLLDHLNRIRFLTRTHFFQQYFICFFN